MSIHQEIAVEFEIRNHVAAVRRFWRFESC